MPLDPAVIAGREVAMVNLLGRALSQKELAALLAGLLPVVAETGNEKMFDIFAASTGGHLRGHVQSFKQINGQSLLSVAVLGGKANIVRGLLQLGAPASDGGKKRHPAPLTLAASCGNTAAARVLLEYGADPLRVEGKPELVPLHAAAKNGHAGCVTLFLDKGVPTNLKGKWGHTALFLAVEQGHLEVAAAAWG